MIKGIFTTLIGLIILFPFLIMVGFNIYTRKKKHYISMKKAADWTTPFLIVSVFIIARAIFGEGVGFFMLTFVLVLSMVYSYIEWKRSKEFGILFMLQKIWRLLFLMFTLLYILFIVMGIIFAIVEHLQ